MRGVALTAASPARYLPPEEMPEMSPALRRQAVVIVVTLATVYVASHFFRAANVTIGLDLMRELGIGPETLGALTGAFFFGFSAMQLPCGLLFDRYGPRLTVFAMLLLAIVGATIFTLAYDPTVLVIGRTLMGAGFGVMLIGSMVVISRWFPPDRFATLTALVMIIGLAGNLIATTPLAWATQLVGWRVAFAAVVVFTAVGALAVWLVVRDAPPGHPFLAREPETPAAMLRGLIEVLRSPGLPYFIAINFCNYACTFTVQGLWGGPYLKEVHGLSPVEFGNVLLAAVVAYMLGQMIFGPLDRLLDTRKYIAMGGTLAIAALLAIMALVERAPLWLGIVMIVGTGFLSASSMMIMAHARAGFADRLIGRAIGTLNTSVMLGVAVMQSLSGFIIGAFERLPDGVRPEIAYRTLYGVLALVLVVACAIYARVGDIKPSQERRLA
jgi:predicted MFS family arabinose efflux permease